MMKRSMNALARLALCTMIEADVMGDVVFAYAAVSPIVNEAALARGAVGTNTIVEPIEGDTITAAAWLTPEEGFSKLESFGSGRDLEEKATRETGDGSTLELGAAERQEGSTEQEPETESSEQDTAVDGTLLLSFMVLRALIAVRSVNGDSQKLMWLGIAFASVSRAIYEGRDVFSSPSAMILSGLKEFSHVYGLCYVLRSFPVASGNSTD